MSKQIQGIFDGVMEIIANANALVDDTSVPDMDEMKREVARLCKAINALPVKERVTYAGDLGLLFDALSVLETKLIEKRGEVGAMLSEAPTHKAASKAYAKTEQSDSKSKNKKKKKNEE